MISKSGQPSNKPPCSTAIDLSRSQGPAMAIRMDFADYEAEGVQHQHPQGQLILALHGAVTCRAESGVWIVPPDCGVWIPGGVPHSNQVTSNARLTYLFVEPGTAMLPDECCTLSVSPMLREMIHRIAELSESDTRDAHVDRLVRVMLDELALMPRERLKLPVSDHLLREAAGSFPRGSERWNRAHQQRCCGRRTAFEHCRRQSPPAGEICCVSVTWGFRFRPPEYGGNKKGQANCLTSVGIMLSTVPVHPWSKESGYRVLGGLQIAS